MSTPEGVITPFSENSLEICECVAEAVVEHQVAVVQGFFDHKEARALEIMTATLLLPSLPLRGIRVASERLLGRERTPEPLQRRPISVRRDRVCRYFGSHLGGVIGRVDRINDELHYTDALATTFEGRRHLISKVVLNRTALREEFEAHQDSQSAHGLAYVIQFSPTRWILHSGGRGSKWILLSSTQMLAILLYCDTFWEQPMPHNRHTGFYTFFADGSPVHSGINLTNHTRYSLALFCE